MSVKIGSARISENGTINGKKGDQTTNECSIQLYYVHSKKWVCIRPKNPSVAEMIAKNMENICANQNFGYGQDDRDSAYVASKPYGFDASKVTVPCNIDCSLAVLICCLFAGIDIKYDSNHPFYTGNIVSRLKETGQFDVYYDADHCTTDSYLKRGDILCTATKGHVVAVLTNGDKVNKYKANTWYKDSVGWWYAKTENTYAVSEWMLINHHWYYFNDKGYAVKGLQIINGKRYFFEDTVNAQYECACMKTNSNGELVEWYVNN